MDKEDQRQRLYNHIGIILVIGILGGTGLLLMKYSDGKKEPIKITEPPKTQQERSAEVKGEQISAKVNINTATLEELDKLTGIGPATAQKIIDYRTQNGPFKTVEDLKNVAGIGDAKFENIKEEIDI